MNDSAGRAPPGPARAVRPPSRPPPARPRRARQRRRRGHRRGRPASRRGPPAGTSCRHGPPIRH